MFLKRFFSSFLLIVSFIPLYGKISEKQISPLDFGLRDAKTGIERFWVLYYTHIAAVRTNAIVSYKDIESLDLEIPSDAISIPLSFRTDFWDVVLNVTNRTKDFYLFEMVQSMSAIDVTKEEVDKGYFHQDTLQNGLFLLALIDKTPWVKRREGYGYGHYRKDLLFVKNGKAKNKPISMYNNIQTDVEATICAVSKEKKKISNVVFNRDAQNTHKVYFVRIDSQYRVELNNIKIYTPPSVLIDDKIIYIANCYDVLFQDVWIDGSYSRTDHSGYGIELNNVSNISFNNLYGFANWGIFGNNNVNCARLVNCTINRFDIHCYGKDISFEKCEFKNLYNSFTSIYGKIVFSKCVFYDFIPFFFGSSYNAYTKFDLYFKKCNVHIKKSKNYLIYARALNGVITTEREELSKQECPNIFINGLNVITENADQPYYLFIFNKTENVWRREGIPGKQQIKNVSISGKNTQIRISNL